MIIWGAIWGAVVSVLLSRGDDSAALILGALFGAAAGWSLRRAVRNELTRWSTERDAKAASAPTATAQQASAVVPPTSAAAISAASDSAIAPTVLVAASASAPTVAVAAPAMAATPTTVGAPDSALAASMSVEAPVIVTARQPDLVSALFAKAKAWLFGGNTVARVGAVVLFIGLSFLAKWAADNALFPPELRLAGIGLVGIALLVQGARLSNRTDNDTTRTNYAILLQGAGVAVLYLAIFAAFKLYAMIPALVAFVLMALVCALSTVIAVLRNTQALAFVGFAGAFATPSLVATGGGNHVALFSYYLLLNIAIAGVAYLRAWRALNLLGFFATFLVATIWGALKYNPGHYASTQPFLIAFFAIYVAVGLFYALRHSDTPKHTVDGMLIFGTPIVSFALQTQLVAHFEYGAAISAIVASAIYVLLAFALRRREEPTAVWLTLSYAALALIFATLAVPLALDGRLTAAIWAVEGAGVFWLATRQKRWMGQAFGALMQLLAALAFAESFEHAAPAMRPFANSHFFGMLMLAISGLAISWWAYCAARDARDARDAHEPHALEGEANLRSAAATFAAAPEPSSPALLPEGEERNAPLIQATNILFFLVGFAWALGGLWSEVLSSAMQLDDAARLGWFTFSFVALTFAAFLAWQKTLWSSTRYPVLVVLPFLIACATLHFVFNTRASLWFDVLLWPLCFALHLIMLRGVDALSPARWWRLVHVGNMLLLVLLIGGFLNRVIAAAELRHTDWAVVILLFASTLVMLALASPRVWSEQTAERPLRWPLDRFQREYAVSAGLGVAALTTLGALAVACTASSNATPLPYVPLLNPVDLCAFMAVASVALWMRQLRASSLVAATSPLRSGVLVGVLAFVAFIVVNTVWLRFAHHFRGIDWNGSALAESFFVQAGYSMLWTLLGVALMFIAHRKGIRVIWQAGAALLALTVVKLLMVDLANSGGGERIVAFIGVGVLMVAVGYFAPLPPASAAASTKEKNTESEREHA